MRLLACLIVAPQRGYDEPAIFSYAISSFCPTSADGLHVGRASGQGDFATISFEWEPHHLIMHRALRDDQSPLELEVPYVHPTRLYLRQNPKRRDDAF